MKKGGIICIGLLLTITVIWTSVWYSHKGIVEEKFQGGLASYDFSFNQDLGYYIKTVDEETKFLLPNQKMPGLTRFSLDFQKKILDCYTYSGDKRLWMRWKKNEDSGQIFLNIVLLDKQGEITTALSPSEIDAIVKGDSVLAQLVVEAEQIYRAVYQ